MLTAGFNQCSVSPLQQFPFEQVSVARLNHRNSPTIVCRLCPPDIRRRSAGKDRLTSKTGGHDQAIGDDLTDKFPW